MKAPAPGQRVKPSVILRDMTRDTIQFGGFKAASYETPAGLIPTHMKGCCLALAERAGFSYTEAVSLVSPKIVPQMVDAPDVLAWHRPDHLNLVIAVLVAKPELYEEFRLLGFDEIAGFTAASEVYLHHNKRRTIDQDMEAMGVIARLAQRDGIRCRAHESTYVKYVHKGGTEKIPLDRSIALAVRLFGMGFYEIAFADTKGDTTSQETYDFFRALRDYGFNMRKIAAHIHQGEGGSIEEKIAAAHEAGVFIFDVAAGGFGGSNTDGGTLPGNTPAEEVHQIFTKAGIHTGLDLRGLIGYAYYLNQGLGLPLSSPIAERHVKALLREGVTLEDVLHDEFSLAA